MQCKVIREKLSAFLEGTVSPEEKKLIGEHLSVCQPCSTVLEDLRKTEVLVKGLKKVEPPAWLKQKVAARIRAEEEAKKSILHKLFSPLHVKIPIEAFATVLIAVAAIYIFKPVEPEMKRIPSLSSGPVALAPREKAIPKKDLSTGDKGDLARSEENREKRVSEEKKSLVAEVTEGESKAELSKPVAGERPSEAMLAEKEGPIEGRREEVAREAESPKPRVSAKQLPAREGPAKQEDSMVLRSAGIEMMRKSGTKGFAGGATETAAEVGLIGITIHVMDVKLASEKVENLLGQLGAQKIKRESLQNTEVISAELQAEKIKDLFDKLASIGEVKEKGVPSESTNGDSRIRIEIVRSH